jgi:O-antigen/teichoic acid export membrane protein
MNTAIRCSSLVEHDGGGAKAARLSPDSTPALRTSPRPLDAAVSGAFWANLLLIANTVLRSGTTILLMPALIAILGEEQYALWITISTVTMYVSLSEAGIGQSVVNSVGEAFARGDLTRIGQVQSTAHVLYWILVIPTAILSLACLVFLPVDRWLLADADAHHGPLLVACLMTAIVLALARIPMLVFPGLLTGLQQMPTRLACELATTILVAVGTLTAAALGAGLMGMTIAVNLLLFTATISLGLLSSRGRPWARLRISKFRSALLWPLAANSGFFFLMSAAAVLDRSALTLLVARFGSLALAPPMFFLLSVFRVAAWSLVSAASRAIQPYVLAWKVDGEHERIATVTCMAAKLSGVTAALFAAGFVPFAEPIISVWVGPGSFPGMTVLILVAGAFLADAVLVAPVNLMMVMDEHRKLALLTLAKSLLVVGGALAGGMMAPSALPGLAAGMFAATIIGNVAIPLLAYRALRIDRRRYLDHCVGRPVAYAVAVLAAAALASTLPMAWTKVFLVAAVLAASSAFAWLAVFDRGERRAWLRIWQRVCGRATGAAAR